MSKSRSSDPTATRAHEQDSPLPVYFAWFTGNAPEAIFVEKDCVERSGRLMSPLSFLNDALVGTRYELSSAEALEKMPTFVRKELIGYVEPESLSFLNAVCRTVLSLERSRARPFGRDWRWWKSSSFRIYKEADQLDVAA